MRAQNDSIFDECPWFWLDFLNPASVAGPPLPCFFAAGRFWEVWLAPENVHFPMVLGDFRVLSPRMDQVGAEMGHDSARMAHNRPEMAPRWHHDGPRWLQDGLKMVQDGPKMP